MEIAFQTIAEIIVALVAVMLLLFVISAMLPGVAGSTYCIIGNSISSLPIPSFLKPNTETCSFNTTTGKQVLDTITTKRFSDYVVECWNKNKRGSGGLTYDCYELFIQDVPDPISERALTDHFKEEYICPTLPDNFLEAEGSGVDCGGSNKVLWRYPGNNQQPTEISGTDVTVVIKYNAFDHRIEII